MKSKTPGKQKSGRLTDKQERYCFERASGKGKADAYAAAGYSTNQSRESMRVNAAKMELYDTTVIQRIRELKDAAAAGMVLDRDARIALLAEFALNKDGETGKKDRLRALDMLNKIAGDYSDAVRVQIDGGIELTRADAFDAALDELR